MSQSYRGNRNSVLDLASDPHMPFNTVKHDKKFAIQMKTKKMGDSFLAEPSQSVIMSQVMINENENLIQIIDQKEINEGGAQEEPNLEFQEISDTDSEFEGGEENGEESEPEENNSDDEQGF